MGLASQYIETLSHHVTHGQAAVFCVSYTSSKKCSSRGRGAVEWPQLSWFSLLTSLFLVKVQGSLHGHSINTVLK